MLLGDEQLMLDFSQGSISAFELLIQRWDKRMLNYFMRCVGHRDEAEDLRQELFLRIFEQRGTFRSNGRFQAWIYRVATNLVIDKFARKRRANVQSIEENTENGWEPNIATEGEDSRNSAGWKEIERRIHQALERLPDDQRLILVMRHFENLSFKDIAELLQASESTVKSKVYRGLNALRNELKRLGILEMDCPQSA